MLEKTILGAASGINSTVGGSRNSTSLPLSLSALVADYKDISVQVDPVDQAVWCTLGATGTASITRGMIADLQVLRQNIRKLAASEDGAAAKPKFFVARSALPGIFNLGGELQFFIECIRNNEKDALRTYAIDCVHLIYDMNESLSTGIYTIGLVQGDALGGGFEAALSFNSLIAERGTKMGLPETLFNAFPGMGAFSLLSRKIGPVEAERMILSGKIYLAEELFEMGVISILVDKGEGEEAVRTFIRENGPKHGMLMSLSKVRRRVVPIRLEELEEVADIWVDNCLTLEPKELRRMELLALAQGHRLST